MILALIKSLILATCGGTFCNPILIRLRQEDHCVFKHSLHYKVRLCLKTNNKKSKSKLFSGIQGKLLVVSLCENQKVKYFQYTIAQGKHSCFKSEELGNRKQIKARNQLDIIKCCSSLFSIEVKL